MNSIKGNLRKEKSINCSGKLLNKNLIPLLKEKHYIVKDYELDGDAPKQFIKVWFYEKESGIKKASTSSWVSFIAKTAEKWYPHESIIEFMINRIGQVLGLNMNGIMLLMANGQYRFLSRYFLKKDEKLIHGAEICGEHLGDILLAKEIAEHKNSSRELFTFEFIRDAIRNVYPNCFESLLQELVKMIAFDALVGNNDRHFYNWGVIDTKTKTTKLPTFAPIYDSARGLLWNFDDASIKHLLNVHNTKGRKLIKYIDEASPRISIEENTQANHFELIDFIIRLNNENRYIVSELATEENEQKVLIMLKKEFFPFFIPERSKIIELIISTRFKKIRDNSYVA